ncbi:MAG: threonine/serine dehydratase [Acidobacteria bacterium]|nr:MAG: threonine/serine dehydratase [Acidobacteriota bacterium]
MNDSHGPLPPPPTVEAIRAARAELGERVVETPVWRWRGREIEARAGADTAVFLKLELFQYAGTFKPRGALLNMLALDRDALARGVTAVSAGNHAIAVAYAARTLGTTAKVVMPENANPARVAICRAYGAEVVLVADVHRAFDEVHRIERREGRAFIHPFEGERTALGTATVGLELCQRVPDLDAVVVPIGGGGLCAGVAAAVKQLQPQAEVYGVEPEGADTMHRSFAAGRPESIDRVRTIADSLGAPHAAPYTFSLCRRFVDQLVRVDDDALRRAMGLLFRDMKLAVEPAGAATTAALTGPLRQRLRGRRVGLIVCGANTDLATFAAQARDDD